MEDFGVDSSDQSEWFTEGYPEDVRQFLTETGAIELISCLDDNPKRFETLTEQLDYSRSIINERLSEAQGLKLVKRAQQSRGDKLYRVHALTPMGKRISSRMQEIGLSQTHQRLWAIRNEYEQYKEEFEEWVDDPDGLVSKIEEYREMLYQEHTEEGSNTDPNR